MLPPDFEDRKRAAQRKSALTRFLNRLREHGLDPDSFTHRLVPEADEQPLHDALAPWFQIDKEEVEKVPDWAAVSDRVAIWAAGNPEVAVRFYDGGPGGWLVVPGSVLSAHLGLFRMAASPSLVGSGSDLCCVTPDRRAGLMYFEDEHENVFGVWGDA